MSKKLHKKKKRSELQSELNVALHRLKKIGEKLKEGQFIIASLEGALATLHKEANPSPSIKVGIADKSSMKLGKPLYIGSETGPGRPRIGNDANADGDAPLTGGRTDCGRPAWLDDDLTEEQMEAQLNIQLCDINLIADNAVLDSSLSHNNRDAEITYMHACSTGDHGEDWASFEHAENTYNHSKRVYEVETNREYKRNKAYSDYEKAKWAKVGSRKK